MRTKFVTALTVFLAVGMLAGFAGPVAADTTANASVDQGDQTNTQASSQNADVSAEDDADVSVSQSNAQVNDQEQTGVAIAEATDDSTTNVSITADELGGEITADASAELDDDDNGDIDDNGDVDDVVNGDNGDADEDNGEE